MNSDIGLQITRNSLFNLLGALLAVPIALLLTPYIFHHLGKDEFGIWVLVSVLSSYAQLSDFGITESLIRFVAEYKVRWETAQLNQLINTALTVYIVLALIFGFLFLFILNYVVNEILQIPLLLQAKAVYVFTIAIVLFFLNLIASVFGSMIVGFQRMDQSNIVAIASALLTACGAYIVLEKGYGLKGLIHNSFAVTLMIIAANIFIARRLFPEMRINPWRFFKFKMLRTIFKFSWKVHVSMVSQLMIYQIDRVLLSHYVGLSAVSIYEVANRIATQVKVFIASLFNPMIPAAAALQANNKDETITSLYNRSFKYMAVISIPFSFLVIGFAHPFMARWMGPGFEQSAVSLQFLMLAYMINLLPGPGCFILSGVNKPGIVMRASLMGGITNVALSLIAVKSIGYYGVIVGIFISLLSSALYFFWMLHRNIKGLRWQLYSATLIRPLILSLLMGASLLLINLFLPVRGYPFLFILGGLYILLFVWFMVKHTDYFDEFDLALIGEIMPFKLLKRFS